MYVYKILTSKLISIIDVYRVKIPKIKFSQIVDEALNMAHSAINYVIGPTISTPNRVPQWDNTTGTLLKDGLDVGVLALNLVQLDASAKLPAVDGSQLTGIGADSTTQLSITGILPSGSVFSVTVSGTNYTKSGDAGNLGASAAYFNSMEKIQIFVNGIQYIKGSDVVWVSATTFILNQDVDNGDEILILS